MGAFFVYKPKPNNQTIAFAINREININHTLTQKQAEKYHRGEHTAGRSGGAEVNTRRPA